jgi:anaphase-promoting complex subunit 1
LRLQNECISTAIILGRAISRIGSCDKEVGKLCFIHIPNSQAVGETSSSSGEIEIPISVQSAAVAGLGFVFAESGDKRTVGLLLKEISMKPLGDKQVPERECYSLSAAFGLGLVCLGQGAKSGSKLEDKLFDLIQGSEADAVELPTDNSARCSLLYESATVNRCITLPGACIALGLAYLRTNDSSVADRIRIPKTPEQLELEEYRADSLMYKYLAKSLILWDKIEPSRGWIENQLPQFLRDPNSIEHKENRQYFWKHLCVESVIFHSNRTGHFAMYVNLAYVEHRGERTLANI